MHYRRSMQLFAGLTFWTGLSFCQFFCFIMLSDFYTNQFCGVFLFCFQWGYYFCALKILRMDHACQHCLISEVVSALCIGSDLTANIEDNSQTMPNSLKAKPKYKHSFNCDLVFCLQVSLTIVYGRTGGLKA